MLVAFFGLSGRFQKAFVSNPENGDAYQHGDEISHAKAGTHDKHGVVESLVGTDGGDGIKDRSRQHVGEGAGNRETVFYKPPNDRDDSAFADGEDGSQHSAGKDGEEGIFGENFLEGVAGKIGSQKAADQGAQKDKGKALEEDREKFE